MILLCGNSSVPNVLPWHQNRKTFARHRRSHTLGRRFSSKLMLRSTSRSFWTPSLLQGHTIWVFNASTKGGALVDLAERFHQFGSSSLLSARFFGAGWILGQRNSLKWIGFKFYLEQLDTLDRWKLYRNYWVAKHHGCLETKKKIFFTSNLTHRLSKMPATEASKQHVYPH